MNELTSLAGVNCKSKIQCFLNNKPIEKKITLCYKYINQSKLKCEKIMEL